MNNGQKADIYVDISGHDYHVHIEQNLLSKCADYIAPFLKNDKILIITDSNVERAILPELTRALLPLHAEIITYIMPAGEPSKNWAELEKITNWMILNGVERSSHVIALGGGVVGDIVGFAAHIVKRGCHFIQIPTSLLAQVDSSVGGKTAINSPMGKNLIGAFHQPAMVLIDPNFLNSLPKRHVAAGFAEILKYGLINDADFFQWCSENVDAFFDGDIDARIYAIKTSIASKAAIVAEDEKELSGTRALLNLGHTFGHALEAETGFSEILLHGEGVAAGMALAARYSEWRGDIQAGIADNIAAIIKRAGLPTNLAECGINCAGEKLVEHMLHDKKLTGGNLPFLLMRGIGETYLAKDVDLSDVAAFLNDEKARGNAA
ncbi:3-dehydroquinate synthase [Sphingorhabdus lutea]|uniref:3-dehydroquinate synthase n=1 Tax=Sphingorhabdus lutea TaxID=1913578 RepID=A0A1L3JCM0_9SPHN|nr:3-dehydroquinate synthase [Sphingorhabdus lutea]APG62897.1 3-dehydroquinate synthase [Sphingorhabdus lutea]